MDSLLQQLDRFAEVLAVSRTTHVRGWDPAAVRRALQWAAYLRHVHRRFGRHVRIRAALERRLHQRWQQAGWTSFGALARCDLLLAQRLLDNPALGPAALHSLLQQLLPGPGAPDAAGETLPGGLALLARRRSAVHVLRLHALPEQEDSAVMRTQAELLLQRVQQAGRAGAEAPGGFLCSLWERRPHGRFLQVTAAALLLLPSPSPQPREEQEQLELDGPETPGEGSRELVRWLLSRSDVMDTFCRSLPAGLVTSVAGRHPELFQVYLGLLTDWGRRLHYDLQKGVWVGAESHDVPWEELYRRFQSLCQAPAPLKEDVLTALEACKARDGGFQGPGLSIWTDLLSALGSGA